MQQNKGIIIFITKHVSAHLISNKVYNFFTNSIIRAWLFNTANVLKQSRQRSCIDNYTIRKQPQCSTNYEFPESGKHIL